MQLKHRPILQSPATPTLITHHTLSHHGQPTIGIRHTGQLAVACRAVKLVDGTTLSMPDTAANQACYPQSGVQAVGLGFPLAMLVALISLSTGAVLRWATGPCRGKGTGEQALFRELMPHLAMGDIILADRFY